MESKLSRRQKRILKRLATSESGLPINKLYVRGRNARGSAAVSLKYSTENKRLMDAGLCIC